MARAKGSETKSAEVFTTLRADIIAGRLAPGTRLKPDEVRKSFDVSISVVREALTALVGRGLVESEYNKGFRVKTLDKDEVLGLIYVREINECAALKMAVERHDTEWESEVLAAHFRMSRHRMYLDEDSTHRNDEWAQAHAEFHDVLLRGCRNNTLISVCNRLADEVEMYRGWTTVSARDSEEEVAANHRELLDAVLDRDAEGVVQLHRRHLGRTVHILLGRLADLGGAEATEPDEEVPVSG